MKNNILLLIFLITTTLLTSSCKQLMNQSYFNQAPQALTQHPNYNFQSLKTTFNNSDTTLGWYNLVGEWQQITRFYCPDDQDTCDGAQQNLIYHFSIKPVPIQDRQEPGFRLQLSLHALPLLNTNFCLEYDCAHLPNPKNSALNPWFSPFEVLTDNITLTVSHTYFFRTQQIINRSMLYLTQLSCRLASANLICYQTNNHNPEQVSDQSYFELQKTN